MKTNTMTTEHPTGVNPTNAVHSFIRALNDEDFNQARKYLTDDFKFEGVMGSRDGGDAYMNDMRNMKFKYDIQKVFTEGDDVCLLRSIWAGR